MRHYSLPMTMTPEQLADYIRTNRKDTQNHVEKIPLTPEEIQNLEHESSVASRAILVLKQTEADFKYFLKKGTDFDNATGQYKPQTVTIPPTKGTEKLEANRDHAEKKIMLGYREDVTALYLLPHPEAERMIMVDIEGNEWPNYSRQMSSDEVKQYGKPVLKAIKNQMMLNDAEKEELDL